MTPIFNDLLNDITYVKVGGPKSQKIVLKIWARIKLTLLKCGYKIKYKLTNSSAFEAKRFIVRKI